MWVLWVIIWVMDNNQLQSDKNEYMEKKTIIDFSKDDVLKLLSEAYNSANNTKHLFELISPDKIPEIVSIKLIAWNKDEKGH